MNELDLLTELGDETPLPDPAALGPARARLVAELRAAGPRDVVGSGPRAVGSGRRDAAGPGRRAGPGRDRRRWRAVALGAAAAVAAGVVTVVVVPHGGGGTAVADVLDRAATAAAAEPDRAPGPDQYLYLRTVAGGRTGEGWFSIDGTRDGRDGENVFYGCRNGRRKVDPPEKGTYEDCTPDPAYLPDLPTTADGMLAHLRDGTDGEDPESVTNSTLKGALELVEFKLLRPAARAALFEAVRQVPGATVVRDARDGSGRPGVGVSWSYGGGAGTTLVFDRTTYEFLGTTMDSLQRRAVVDRVGQRP